MARENVFVKREILSLPKELIVVLTSRKQNLSFEFGLEKHYILEPLDKALRQSFVNKLGLIFNIPEQIQTTLIEYVESNFI